MLFISTQTEYGKTYGKNLAEYHDLYVQSDTASRYLKFIPTSVL